MSLKEKRILVAGGTGFVGSNLLLRLIEDGCQIKATRHKRIPQVVHKNIHYIQCDLMNPTDCGTITQDVDYLFICSAQTSGAAVIEQTPLLHVTPNVIMNTQLLDAAYQHHVEKVMFLSSNTVYPVTDYPVQEDEAQGELFEKYFCVGWMKRFSEILCEMYASKIKNPMKVIVVRPGNLYGEFDNFEWATSHVIPSLIRKVVERHNPLSVWGDGNDLKDFLYIKDFVDGIVKAMDKLETCDPINIAGGHSYSVRDVLETICQVDNFTECNITYDKSKPTMIPKRLIDISKAKKLLDFEPRTSLYEGIKNTVKWYRNHAEQNLRVSS